MYYELMTLKEACTLIKCSPRFIEQLLSEGMLKSEKIGRRTRYYWDEGDLLGKVFAPGEEVDILDDAFRIDCEMEDAFRMDYEMDDAA